MKCVYEPANSVEGHMIVNMLEQHEIHARLEGEHLSSGVGELPASGLLRVVAEDKDFDRAREIIRKWEAKSPSEPTAQPLRKSHAPLWFVGGVVAAVAVMAVVDKLNVTHDGVDHNNDGKLDEHYTYSGQYLREWTTDRNLDGKIDMIFNYDSRGIPVTAAEDQDFDGRLEAKTTLERGNTKRVDIDLDDNGAVDIRYEYANGVKVNATYFLPNGRSVKKRERYEGGFVVSGEVDNNDDGVMDVVVTYDWSGEEIESRSL